MAARGRAGPPVSRGLAEIARLELRREVVRRRLSYEQVAQRCGLHPRTVERALEGELLHSVATLSTIAAALRVEFAVTLEQRRAA